MPTSKQNMKNVEVGGKLLQRSDNPSTQQNIEHAAASEATQEITGQQPTLRIGKWSATGLWAVIGLVVVAVVALLVKYATR
jgi:hypothetical protein